MERAEILRRLGLGGTISGAGAAAWVPRPSGGELASISPIDGGEIARIRMAGEQDYDLVVQEALEAFQKWRTVPAPVRGLMVRDLGEELRKQKEELARLVSLEMGKILPESRGEVQEMIDICDFAVGLSRQLYGLSMHSERPGHRMFEQWHPLGPVGVITAFNFPVAVWSWNAVLAAVCGDAVVWKPSPETPLCALAVHQICRRVMERHSCQGIFSVVVGEVAAVGERMLQDRQVPLVSATGSCRMGRRVAEVVGGRLGRTLLELGGNNGVIVMNDADLELALRAVVFGAVGTAGQRCTSIRRLFLQRDIAEKLTGRLQDAYKQVQIGDPMDNRTLMGPLVNRKAVEDMRSGLKQVREQGGEVLYGGGSLDRKGGCYVEPTLVRAKPDMPMLQHELFAPVLYMVEFSELEEAIAWHNNVPQGLSSAMFARDLMAAETFLSARGSDCGIANINIGTSGAEIGGAFGGEKDTGGGRESGSDSWKSYMRRQTVTINWSGQLPLAQGIRFGLEGGSRPESEADAV
jgi:aldehyde dehydrogenase (NAD+)